MNNELNWLSVSRKKKKRELKGNKHPIWTDVDFFFVCYESKRRIPLIPSSILHNCISTLVLCSTVFLATPPELSSIRPSVRSVGLCHMHGMLDQTVGRWGLRPGRNFNNSIHACMHPSLIAVYVRSSLSQLCGWLAGWLLCSEEVMDWYLSLTLSPKDTGSKNRTSKFFLVSSFSIRRRKRPGIWFKKKLWYPSIADGIT